MPQVSASRPLVEASEAQLVGRLLPADLSAMLTDSYAGQALTYQQYQLLLGRDYVSALGQTCREITVAEFASAQDPQRRVVCESNQQWRLMPEISDQSGSEMVFEVTN
ncbi:hypothetical protein [Ferrimonas balearica]|uniref:hypothetical protein n=1 Tax=Ferrimonas balearica TaxID=44012 RepID=UPI001C57199A|nr:hypothetical protein [Ferrimonas balearica]MBW3138185.1 hypothetical protein [Ferrimonas balearica]MBW3164260.1 hypothetical protein [Ferrimonas balearica]MBY6105250.1 hypothetical protein [Ferrimonas balearica]MBY6225100.1 hypothetical protein [Ferrimonas balearica]